ncbi:MAG: Crp/Fnr family transcriptional regulator [Chloroflexota bacterium]
MAKEKELIKILQAIPWFQKLSDEHFKKISKISSIKMLSTNEVLFKQGDSEKSLYILIEGRIGLDIYGPVKGYIRVYTAEPMDVVGWSSATPVIRQRTASATAVLDSRLIAIDAVKLNQLCEEDHHLGYIVMRRLANVVAARLMISRLQTLDLFAHPAEES